MSGNDTRGRIRAMLENTRGRWGKTAAEVALVALFFLAFLFLLNFLFPSGTGLRSLIRGGATGDPGAEWTGRGPRETRARSGREGGPALCSRGIPPREPSRSPASSP
jgi:hypothetical protein